MKGLERFEAFAEQLLEGSFSRWAGGRLEPVEIAKRLAREMDAHQTVGAGKVFVPNRYRVYLNPATLKDFKPFQSALEDELRNYLIEVADRRQFSFVDRPHVTLEEETGVRPGDMRVSSQLTDAQGATLGNANMTQELQVAAIRSAAAASGTLTAWLFDGQRQIPVRSARFSMGRALDNDLVLEGSGVSRHHAQVEHRYSRYVLRDLNSTHGTLVNGQPVQEVVLRDGDIITLGGERLTFRLTAPPSNDDPTLPSGAPLGGR
ncbi:MAG: DUF3662 and FHA domain-containing protein [Anaerolineae bacterium]